MPELPEVETVARQLASAVTGRRVGRVRLLDPLLRKTPGWRAPTSYGGRLVRRVFRHGKQVLFDLEPRASGARPLFLAVHLRMTGRLGYSKNDHADREHLRAVIELDRGAVLFHDTRRFGTVRWLRDPEEAAPGAVDPMGERFTVGVLAELLGGSKQELKPWLLRQDRLVGLGNIYASEILHVARLSPVRPAGALTRAEVRRLRLATRKVLARAIENCGTTFSDFQDAHGVTGSYQEYLAVYAREGEPCPRCREPVERLVQQQRSTFFCPVCAR
ncbi:MAG: bifunctional DNA-formamidopyrimidine glycosylase/DNA-(apurinic or apyrimidinic site) lyase [Acidobacteriota bacterium]|nr:bifunctional DNA-formamidopyrimidine glycosylase/DNA-(apurinic or apyrimidinic site) lyase [Acidobacteriota bacterium]